MPFSAKVSLKVVAGYQGALQLEANVKRFLKRKHHIDPNDPASNVFSLLSVYAHNQQSLDSKEKILQKAFSISCKLPLNLGAGK